MKASRRLKSEVVPQMSQNAIRSLSGGAPHPSVGDAPPEPAAYTCAMTNGGAGGQDQPRSLIRASNVWRRPEGSARAELVWNEDVPTLKAVDIDAPSAAPAEPLPPALATETEELGHAESASGAPSEAAMPTAEDVLAVEIAQRRQEMLEQLDVELRTRRTELARSLERQRAESEQRIAGVERLEAEAIARRREAILQSWQADEGRALGDRIDAALAEQLGELRGRYADAETRIRQHIESRQREEAARLEQWRASERERIEAELTTEERRFNDRLMRQLQEFEYQLAERAREQEERLARAWGDAEERAKQQLAALFSPPTA